ncbi:UNVERIFIED_CONTAM: hypothetical protein GTU68_061419 [Idotea baltica]|nr:hypothetical protein [Idotea baltica]
MLSHNNIGSNVSAASDALPIELGNRTLSFLPLCHIFERTVFYSYLYKCVSLYYAESIETIGDDIRDVKPHYFTSVPRLLEKVYDKIVAKGNDLEGFKKKLFFWALELGDQYDLRGKGPVYKVKLAIARKLIFSKWKDALGGEILGIITGAAALQSRLERVFNAAGIRVRQGYGMTESSPVITINRFDDNDAYLATVGKPVKGVQVKIDEVTGEICAKGPNVMMGYLNRPDATAETIDADGWLRTGDKGEWVDGKYLRITDRIKSLFKTSGGKYVAPQVIENKYKESPLIEQIMVVGNDRKFVGALIVPSLNLLDHCKENGIEANTLAEAVKNDKVIAHYESICSHFNENFSKIEKIKRFRLMPNDWTIDGGEMTPTMKLKRKKIEAKYMDYIEDIYNV